MSARAEEKVSVGDVLTFPKPGARSREKPRFLSTGAAGLWIAPSGGSHDPRRCMFTDQLRHAVEASPRCELPRVSAALWKAYAAGQVGEADAQSLSDLIEARKALPPPQKPANGAAFSPSSIKVMIEARLG